MLSRKKTGHSVTIEEHQVYGGMGSAVAECLAANYPVLIEFIGVHDRFGQSGTREELIEFYGMGRDAIMKAAKTISRRWRRVLAAPNLAEVPLLSYR